MSLEIKDITAHRLIPVVVLADAAQAEPLGAALVAGGLPVAEVTFRTAAAAASIAAMSRHAELLVGAGTVTRPEQVDQAADAGARFIVSPGFSAPVVERALELGLPVLPGVATPTEILMALSYELGAVKFFPAGNYGGAATIKALAGPFPGLQFVPTGGVSLTNLADYLSLPMVPACGGSWMVPAKAITAGDFAAIEQLCKEAVAAAAAI